MTTTADTPDAPFSGIQPAADADPHLRELPLSAQWVLRGNFLQVSRDRVQLPNGRESTREYIHHPGAAVIVPILEDGRLLLERQYRYPMGRVMLEFPAGKLDPDEPPLVCAQRELLEETGYRATEWAHAGVMHNAIAYSTERIEIFFARGLVAGERKLDEGEFLDVVAHDQDTLERMAVQGELTDAKSLTCLLWLSRWRSGAWPLDWHPAA
ncbi:NUDIX domain-containing protein [Roseateles depolymerans]|uniref:GDP-mannose pyrophosphatase n=1 Tax=Roseateles depolymerans TaxID=76731 RepID=A0A0U3LH81_9BURK|nr:NUDIX hydrolase [Roseateles depolymerans]ALV07455.1 Hydrolase, NUDIX family [Roseateles depolymerans]REG22330.1 ADP-ribose pyrophosphatase [Roseateles depolymerans]